MSGHVRVEFLGIAGVVPNRAAETDDADSYLVTIPDLSDGFADSRLPNPGCPGQRRKVPPHVPAVIVKADTVIGESFKSPALEFVCRRGHFQRVRYALYLFEGEKLEFNRLKATPLVSDDKRVDPDDPDTTTPVPGEESGLQWIPRLSLANRMNGRRTGIFNREEFLHPDDTPVVAGDISLAGTVPIEVGTFCCDGVVKERNGPVKFDIGPVDAAPEWSQSMYRSIFWHAEYKGDRLELVFKSGSSDREGKVALKPEAAHCDIWVANLEAEVLLSLGSGTGATSPGPDLDFAINYLYSTHPPDLVQGMPVPHSPQTSVRGTRLRCKSAMFDY